MQTQYEMFLDFMITSCLFVRYLGQFPGQIQYTIDNMNTNFFSSASHSHNLIDISFIREIHHRSSSSFFTSIFSIVKSTE